MQETYNTKKWPNVGGIPGKMGIAENSPKMTRDISYTLRKYYKQQKQILKKIISLHIVRNTEKLLKDQRHILKAVRGKGQIR